MSSSPVSSLSSATGPLPQGHGAGSSNAARGSDGRFAKGNPGGSGNPFNRQVAALRQALLNAVTPTDLEEIVAVLLIKAKSGDLAAIKLLLSYTIGKPGPAVDPDTLDQQEWQLHQQAAVPPQQVHDLMAAMPAATANLVAQVGWPCAAQQHLQPVVQGLRAAEAAAVPTPPPANPEKTPASEDRSAPTPAREQPLPPSANGGNAGPSDPRAPDRAAGASYRPVVPRPPDLPHHIDWEYEQRIQDILFDGKDPPSDAKRA